MKKMKIKLSALAVLAIVAIGVFVSSCQKDALIQTDSNENLDKTVPTNSASNSESKAMGDYTGQELFAAIYFSHGDFATQIPSYSEETESLIGLNTIDKAKFEDNLQGFITSIEANNPSFFDSFKADLCTHDPIIIEKALKEGGEQMASHLNELYPNIGNVITKISEDYTNGEIVTDGQIDNNKVDANKAEYLSLLNDNMISADVEVVPCSFALVCVAYFVLAVHNQVALTFNVAAAATVAAVFAIKFKIKIGVLEDYNLSDNLNFEMLVSELSQIN